MSNTTRRPRRVTAARAPVNLQMFRDLKQRVDVCRTLLSVIRFESYWNESGPTLRAMEVLRGLNSKSEHAPMPVLLFYRFVWDLWMQESTVGIAALLQPPADIELVRVLTSFMESAARGHDAIDTWLMERARIKGTAKAH